MLFVLVRMLTDDEAKVRSTTIMGDGGSNYLNIHKFCRLRAAENRNLLFSVLLEYIRWGYRTKKDSLLLPLHEMCICIASNRLIVGIDVKAWLNSLVLLLKECQISLGMLFKQLLSSSEELRLADAEQLTISSLELLSQLL